jgi:hypothetical protein
MMDIRVRDKPGGARLRWWRRGFRIRVAGKGTERGIFAGIAPAYIYSLYSKGRVNPSPRVGGWDFVELFFLMCRQTKLCWQLPMFKRDAW